MKKSVVILLHLGYWTIYAFLVLTLLLFINQGHGGHVLPGNFLTMVFCIFTVVPALVSFYISYLFLFPRFLHTKKILYLFLSGIGASIAAALAGALVLSVSFGFDFMFASGDSFYAETITMAIIAFVHAIVALVMRGFIQWYIDIKVKEELTRKNAETELALVKSQINPHFLFNTINNIDVLIEKDAAKASLYLNKLSDIMRFMLYETKTEHIPLGKELLYIEKYIELQKIRTANPNYVDYTIHGDTHNLMIEPMLFIPFIENAFKHAENKKTDHAIVISFGIDRDNITFECSNSYSDSGTKPMESGIGNDLIRKRLALLYPDSHTLQVTDERGTYKVLLKLNHHAH
jgi:two-component system LytT family sensor kinase